MAGVKVKICGINDPDAFDAAVAAGTDWLGFNFSPRSPRYVSPADAAALSARHAGGPRRVGLFVNPTEAEITAALGVVALDVLQLYGTLPNGAVSSERMRARFGLPVWRPVGISDRADLPRHVTGEDALLLEAKPPPSATRPGGNAQRFDWTLLQGWQAPAPWLLAGGLSPGNVAEAILLSGALAVDVSSGVERAPGKKDPDLIRAFVEAAKNASNK